MVQPGFYPFSHWQGLGKTVQCSSFTGYLAETHRVRGPFLVLVPLSTVPNWAKEYRRWLPQLNTVVYVGDQKSREARDGTDRPPDHSPCAS